MSKNTTTTTTTTESNADRLTGLIDLIGQISAVSLVGKAGTKKANDLHKEMVNMVKENFDLSDEEKSFDAIKGVYNLLPDYNSPARRQTAVRSIERAFSKALNETAKEGHKFTITIRERATKTAEKGITLSHLTPEDVRYQAMQKLVKALSKYDISEINAMAEQARLSKSTTTSKATTTEKSTTVADNKAIAEGLKIAGLA